MASMTTSNGIPTMAQVGEIVEIKAQRIAIKLQATACQWKETISKNAPDVFRVFIVCRSCREKKIESDVDMKPQHMEKTVKKALQTDVFISMGTTGGFHIKKANITPQPSTG